MKLLKLSFTITICFLLLSAKEKPADAYQCLPCGLDCDKEIYDHPGICEKCKMVLVKSSTITFTNTEPATVCNYLKQHPGALLLDVRTVEEFTGKATPDFGTLKNAINIPIQELEKRMGELDNYKTREVLVFCSHSHRSPQAAYLLTQHGFKHVVNLSGGMSVVNDDACKAR